MHYRKIYEHNYGPIPKDGEGRSFDIHHIDGNHYNDDLSNLIALSIKDHYDVHYAQGDWGACSAIIVRMNKTPEELSNTSKFLQKKRVEDNIHNFQLFDKEIKSKWAKDAVNKQIADGKNKLIGPENNKKLIELGIHPLIGGRASRKGVFSQLKNGNHACQRIKQCKICLREIKGSVNYIRHVKKCEEINESSKISSYN